MHSLQGGGSSSAGECRRDYFMYNVARARIYECHTVLRDAGVSPRVGTAQSDLARVHNR